MLTLTEIHNILTFQTHCLIRDLRSVIRNSSTSDDSDSVRRSSWPFFVFLRVFPFPTRASSSRRFFIFFDGLNPTSIFPWESNMGHGSFWSSTIYRSQIDFRVFRSIRNPGSCQMKSRSYKYLFVQINTKTCDFILLNCCSNLPSN